MTKLHEEVWRGTLGDAARWIETVGVRGEYVLVIGEPEAPEPADDETIVEMLHSEFNSGSTLRSAAESVASELGVGRTRVYRLALALDEALDALRRPDLDRIDE